MSERSTSTIIDEEPAVDMPLWENRRPSRYQSVDAQQLVIGVEYPSEKDALLFSLRKTIGEHALWQFDGIQSVDHSIRDPLSIGWYVDKDQDLGIIRQLIEAELEAIRISRIVNEERLTIPLGRQAL